MSKTLGAIRDRLPIPNRNTLITLLDQAVVSGSNFLIGILITRWMGLEAYGQFALAWMGVLLGLGLQQALVQMPMMSLRPQKPVETWPTYDAGVWALTLLWIVAAGGLALLACILSQKGFPDWELGRLRQWLPLGLMALLGQDFFRRYGFVRERPGWVLLIDLLGYGGGLGAIIWMWATDSLTVAHIYAGLSASFGAAMLLGWGLFRLRPAWRQLGLVWKAHAQFSGWLIGKSVLQFFASNYFLLAAGALLGTTALGALRMAQNLLGVTHVLFQAMENIVPVRAAQAWLKDGWSGLGKYLRLMSVRSGLVVLGLIGLLALFGEPLITITYGAKYRPYYELLLAYCGLYVFIFGGYPLRFALRTLSQTQPIFWAYVLSTAFSLAAANWMVSSWGLSGVMMGLIIGQVCMQAVYGGWLWRLYRQARLQAQTGLGG